MSIQQAVSVQAGSGGVRGISPKPGQPFGSRHSRASRGWKRRSAWYLRACLHCPTTSAERGFYRLKVRCQSRDAKRQFLRSGQDLVLRCLLAAAERLPDAVADAVARTGGGRGAKRVSTATRRGGVGRDRNSPSQVPARGGRLGRGLLTHEQSNIVGKVRPQMAHRSPRLSPYDRWRQSCRPPMNAIS